MISSAFTRKKVDSLTLGEKLKRIRSEGRISLSEVSKNTKIQVKYLEYIEAGQYDKLPADVYVKGFLRSYANFLGVNEGVFLKLFEREKNIDSNIKKNGQKEKTEEKINLSRFAFTPKILAVAIVSVLIIGGFYYFYRELQGFTATPKLVIIKPVDGEVISGRATYVSGRTEKGASVFINDQPVIVKDNGDFSENINLSSGANHIVVRAKNKFGKESVKSLNIKADYEEIKVEESVPSAAVEEKETETDSPELNMEVYTEMEATWIAVEVDGNLVYSGTLLPKSSQKFSAKEKIVVSSGRANKTFIKVDGEAARKLGEVSGAARNIVFTAK